MKFAYITGQDSSARRKRIIEKYKAGEVDCLVASTILDEGFDAPATQYLILAGGGKAEHRQVQRIGRGMRTATDKERLVVVDFSDKGRWLGTHSKQRLAAYEREPAYTVVELTTHEMREILGLEDPDADL